MYLFFTSKSADYFAYFESRVLYEALWFRSGKTDLLQNTPPRKLFHKKQWLCVRGTQMEMYLRSWPSGTQCQMYARLEDIFFVGYAVRGTRAETSECKCLKNEVYSWVERFLWPMN